MNQNNRKFLSMLGLACVAALSGATANAEEDEPFHIGGSCAALAYTSSSDLADILNETYSDDLGSFCVPEEPMECSDYSPLLKGRPLLQKSLSPYRLVLQDLGLQVATDLHNLEFEILHVSITEGAPLDCFDDVVHALRECTCCRRSIVSGDMLPTTREVGIPCFKVRYPGLADPCA